MVLAAEAPDLDTLWAIRGPIANFTHHRGWTHTLVGIPLDAAAVLGAVWLWHRWQSRSGTPPARAPQPRIPRRLHLRPASTTRVRPAARVGACSISLQSLPFSAISCSTGPTTTASGPSSPSTRAGTPAPSSSSSSPSCSLLLPSASSPPCSSASSTPKSAPAANRSAAAAGPPSPSSASSCSGPCRGYERLHAEDLARTADYGSAAVLRIDGKSLSHQPFPLARRRRNAQLLPDLHHRQPHRTRRHQRAEDLFYKPAETPPPSPPSAADSATPTSTGRPSPSSPRTR